MKTLEDVLYDNTGMLAENHPSIVSAMKEFAIEVAKESLKNAAEWAYMIRGDDTTNIVDGFTICKQSILSETNIPKEVKQ